MNFRLPPSLSSASADALLHSYCAGLPDYMPWTTQATIDNGALRVQKENGDSACLCVPWFVDEKLAGTSILHDKVPVVLSTATLVERDTPYDLIIELARGKINQVRNQAADWQSGGLTVTPQLEQDLLAASKAFAHAVCQNHDSENGPNHAAAALSQGLSAASSLVRVYVDQVFQARRARTPVLPTTLSCCIREVPSPEQTEKLTASFNTVRVPFHWRAIEGEPSQYVWDGPDAVFKWAREHSWQIEGGTLIEFRNHQLPPWTEKHHGDVQSLTNVMVDYVENILNRYKDVNNWNILSGMNAAADLLSLDEEELLWMTAQLLTAALQIRPEGQFSITLTQPWGEPMAEGRWAYSPFVFADALLRHRVQLHSLEVELLQGVRPRGSWWRDRLDTSRMMDLYALLGVPLRITLGCPSRAGADPQADSDLEAEIGDTIWTPEFQALWAENVASLALCKPYLVGVTWCEAADDRPHSFPWCGLIDADGKEKPALQRLKHLRTEYLR